MTEPRMHPRLFTSGHNSSWDEWHCYKVGVHLCVFAGGTSVKICPYPGRALTKREEQLVWETYLNLRCTLTIEQLRAIISRVEDEVNAEKFAESLKGANR